MRGKKDHGLHRESRKTIVCGNGNAFVLCWIYPMRHRRRLQSQHGKSGYCQRVALDLQVSSTDEEDLDVFIFWTVDTIVLNWYKIQCKCDEPWSNSHQMLALMLTWDLVAEITSGKEVRAFKSSKCVCLWACCIEQNSSSRHIRHDLEQIEAPFSGSDWATNAFKSARTGTKEII